MAWEHFEHEADMGIRGIGDSKAEAFEQAAIALTAVVTSPEDVRAIHQLHITCEATDDELLFVEWLNALIYEMSTRNMIFGRFRVTLLPGRIDAHVWGESVDVKRHQPAVEIKGATYTALAVRQTPQGRWMAQCVVDV
jgi:tRNA nucleotidyltransferase (CCA-adding enzyme)